MIATLSSTRISFIYLHSPVIAANHFSDHYIIIHCRRIQSSQLVCSSTSTSTSWCRRGLKSVPCSDLD